MPIAPKFQVKYMYELALQIKRAPEKIRRKQIEAAEELLLDLDEGSLYPLDYVVYRITQYRSDSLEQPMIVGNALIGDIVSLIAIISRTLGTSSEGMFTVAQAADYLTVSTRTLSRLRQEGLVFYWVVDSNGRRRLGCTEEMLQTFKERKNERLTSASHFSRLSNEERKKIIASALEYKGSGRTLNDVALEIANETGRGHETIRGLLQSDARANELLPHSPPLSKFDARVIDRARRIGISWETLTQRYGRTVDALRKAVARQRATKLKQLKINYVELEVFSRGDAEEVILGASVVLNLMPPLFSIDPLKLSSFAVELSAKDEISIVSAMHLLRKRASLRIENLQYSPQIQLIEKIEADLRWAFLLQQQLMLKAVPSSVATAVQHAGRPLHELPSVRVTSLIKNVISIVGSVCGMLDPSKGQFAGKTPSSVLDRALSASDVSQSLDVAAAKQQPTDIICPFHEVVPWSYLLPRTIEECSIESNKKTAAT